MTSDERNEIRVPDTLGGRIDRLFEVERPAGQPERSWTNREVVAGAKAAGFDLSESHLSELRRGIKRNPTVNTLAAISTFFNVRVGWFTDDAVAAEVAEELAAREATVHATVAARREAQSELQDATAELQQAMRTVGSAKIAHRGVNAAAAKEQASMMRALAKALRDDDGDGAEDARP